MENHHVKFYRNPGFNVAHLKPVWDVLDGELQAQIGRLRCGRRVLPQSVKALTFLAEWFSSGAGAYIFLLDIVPGVAVRIVVMDFGFGRVPRYFQRHGFLQGRFRQRPQ